MKNFKIMIIDDKIVMHWLCDLIIQVNLIKDFAVCIK